MKTYTESKLNNGLSIITSADNNSDIITINFVIKSGSRYEKIDERGYAHLLEHMLLKGTQNKPTPYELALTSDRAGALLNASTGPETMQVIIQAAKEKYEEMIELLGDIINHPLFDENILENEKNVVSEEINKAFDNPSKYLWIESNKRIYEGHPLSNYPLGTKESVFSATSQKLRLYYEKFLKSDKIALVISGNIKHDDVKKDAERLFGHFKSSDTEIADYKFSIKKGSDFLPFRGNQTNLSFSFVGLKPSYSEDLALRIIAVFLAGFRTSLLPQELRQKNGLVYGVSASNSIFEDSNLFYVETSSSYPNKVISIVRDKVLNLEKYFKSSDLESYKEQLVNFRKRYLNDPMAEVSYFSMCWRLYNKIVGIDQLAKDISAITYSDILSAKNKYLSENNLFIMEVGNKKGEVEI